MNWSLCLVLVALPGWASGNTDEQVQSLYEKGAHAEAVRIAEAASDATPGLLFYSGLALARLDRLQEAQAAFERGRLLYPGDKRFPLELAGVAYRQKRFRKAKSFLHAALRLDPADEYGHDFLATLYALEGNVPASLRHWNRINKPLIQDVRFSPPPALHPVLRERAFNISGGQIFTLSRLRSTEANLNRLGIFSHWQFQLAPRQDQRSDLSILTNPITQPLAGWAGRLLPVVRGLPYRSILFDRYNLGGRAINFKSLWRWDPNKRRIDLELAAPLRLDPRYGYRLLLDTRDENWDLRPANLALGRLRARKVEAGGDLLFALGHRLDWSTGLRIAWRGFQNHAGSSEFTGGWSFEQRNQFRYRAFDLPERRVRVDSSASLRTGRVIGQSRFAMLEGDVSGWWWPQAKGDAWVAHSRFRAGKTFGRIPFDQFFQLGMERDNDLWLRGHTGTRDGRKGNAPLGTGYTLFQSEFDRTVLEFWLIRLKAGPFFDTGWIAGPNGRFGSRGWLQDTGVRTKVIAAGGFTWTLVYGRDLRGGRGVFYTTVSR